MFDIGWQELFIVAVLALIVIGPKDLPRALRTMGKWVRKVRAMARDFQGGLDDVMREAELDELKTSMNAASDLDIAGEIEHTIDPTGDLASQLDMGEVETDLDAAAGTPPDGAIPDGTAAGPAEPAKPAPAEPAPAKARPRKSAGAAKAPAEEAPAVPGDAAGSPAKASG